MEVEGGGQEGLVFALSLFSGPASAHGLGGLSLEPVGTQSLDLL